MINELLETVALEIGVLFSEHKDEEQGIVIKEVFNYLQKVIPEVYELSDLEPVLKKRNYILLNKGEEIGELWYDPYTDRWYRYVWNTQGFFTTHDTFLKALGQNLAKVNKDEL